MLKVNNQKKIFEEFVPVFYIIFFLVSILSSEILYTYNMISINDFSINIVAFGLLGLCIYIINKNFNKIKFDFYDLIIVILSILGLLSTIFSINKIASIQGAMGRNEGIFQILTYYILFLNCKNIKNKKIKVIIVNGILLLGLIQSIYAILQFTQINNILGMKIIRNWFYSTGLEVNPNFLGSLMTIALSLSISMYFFTDSIKSNIYYAVLSFFNLLGLLMSGTMSAVLALFFFLIFLAISLILAKPNWKVILVKLLSFIILFIVGCCIFNYRDNNFLKSQIKKATEEIGSVAKGEIKDNFGTGRIHIWKEALNIAPKYLLTGAGVDCFYHAFGENHLIDIKSGASVDKAHNEYLQKLITEGLLSFITYLALILGIFIRSLIVIFKKQKNCSNLLVPLFLCFMSYSIQAFFNISVISIAPIYYMVMGLLVSELKHEEN